MTARVSSPPLSLRAYDVLTRCMGLYVGRHLRRRVAIGKEDPQRLSERYGKASLPRPPGTLVWFHVASVGESLSILKLMERLCQETDAHFLVTSGTVTSANIMAKRLPDRAMHQYVPLDHPAYVTAFLKHWSPDLAIWVESELWPNLVHLTSQRQIPCVLLNARMSNKSARSWKMVPGLGSHLLSRFKECLAQDDISAERLLSLGAQSVSVTGNLKLASGALPFDDAERARLETEIGGRPVWVAASTHAGEEEIVIEAHRQIADTVSDLLTIIVPRHPDRGDEVAALLVRDGLKFARRSQQDPIDLSKNIYLADTLGELGLIYALAKVAFVGGSLVPHGGQNPLEPARSDCAIVTGPHTDNFESIVGDLLDAQGAKIVTDSKTLAIAVAALIQDEAGRQEKALQALKVATKANRVLDTIIEKIKYHLPDNTAAKRQVE